MQLINWLVLPSFVFALGWSSCSKPDANLCSNFIAEPYEGFVADFKAGKDDPTKRAENLAYMMVQSKVFCTNMKTAVDTEKSLFETSKWISTDPDSYEKTRKWYKEQCQPPPAKKAE